MVATAGAPEDISRSLGRLEGQVDGLDQRLGGIEQRLGGIEQRLGGIEQRLDRVIFALFGVGAALIAGMVGIMVKLFLDAA